MAVAIEGTPTIGGLPVHAADLPDPDLADIPQWTAFARRLRGQFSIIATGANSSVAVTDLSGCYPVFFNPRQASPQFGQTLASVTNEVPRLIGAEGLARYLGLGTVASGCNLVDGVTTLPGASIGICRGGSVTAHGWSEWSSVVRPSESSASDLEDEFRSLMESWGRIYLPKDGRVGLLLSGGTDSALLAALMKPLLGDRLVSITQDFFLDRYSERAAAAETAEKIGIPMLTCPIGRTEYFEAFRALNSAAQDSVVHHTEAHNMYCLSLYAKERGIDTIITGYNADYLFLGLGYFFEDFPQEYEQYRKATSSLSAAEKLRRVVGSAPPLSPLSRDLLEASHVSTSDYTLYVDRFMEERRRLLEPLADIADYSTLQQLGGQIDGGVAWQDEQGCLSVMRAIPGLNILCPFYDPEIIRLALRLPRNLIFNEGQTKYLLRRVLKAAAGLERPKRPASMSPVRLWRMLPDVEEYLSLSRDLRGVYERLCVGNVYRKGLLSHDLTKTAALGVWLKSHQLSVQ